jgi:large subunit ribosomal protein L9
MKVVLLQHVRNVGQKGEIKEVSDGYFQNFLSPQRLAVPATSSQVNHIHNQQAKATEKLEAIKESALSIKGKIDGKTLSLACKASEAGKLYASLHEKDLNAAIRRDFNVDLPDKQVVLSEPIKSTGDYSFTVRLHKEVTATLTAHVTAE